MAEQIDFVVNGKTLKLTRRGVEQRMAGVAPEVIRSHAVVVSEVRYPVKQVFEVATGLDRLDFTSATARRHLAKLGFELARDSS
jgi:hypothetical protein